MNNTKSKIYILYIALSLISALFCYQNINANHLDKPLFLVPLFYGIVLSICQNLRKNFLSLSIIAINSVCLIRFALYPVMLVVEQNLLFTKESVYLMIYEMSSVLIFLNIYARRLQYVHNDQKQHIYFDQKQIGKLNLVLIPLTLMLGLIFPSLLSSAFSYFGKSSGNLHGALSVFFTTGIMVIYVSILTKLSVLKGNKVFSLTLALLISIIYIFLTSYGGDNVHRWKFLSVGLPTMYVLIESFPRYKKNILTLFCIAITFSIFIGSFIKFSISDVSIENFLSIFITSDSLDVYFGGLISISDALSLLRGDVFANSFESTLTDFFGNMPVASQFFDTEYYSTHSLYLHALGRTDLIIPLTAQSVLHFGVMGTPTMAIIMSIVAVESDRYSKTTMSIFSIFGSVTLCILFSMFMCLSTTILMPQLWKLIIFLTIQYLNKRYF